MPRPFLSGLRGRLILLVLLAVLPAFALTWYTGWEDRQRQRASVADDTVAFARIVANDQERAIDGTRQVLSDLAAIPEVRAGNPERSRTYFTVLMKLYHGYTSFSVIAPDGSVLVSLPAAERPTSFSTRVWFEQALSTKTFAVGDYQIGQLTGKHIVVAAWPVVDEQGRVVSVLAAGLDVTWLNQIAATAQLPSGTVLALVDRRGVIVARYPETAGALGRGFPEAALIASMRQRDEGTVELTGEDGVPRVYAFTPVGGRLETGLRMAVGVPMDVAYGAVNRVQRRHWLVLFMVTVLTLLAAWYAAERFVLRRVSSLLDATRKLAGGDPAARTRLPYDHGELSDLARAFDEMAASLQARQVERDQAERALRESEERFRAFMDNSPALAFVRTDAGEMVYANATLERHFGLGPGGWRGQPPSRFWSPGLADRLARDDAHVLGGGVPEESVDTVVLADGRERYWLKVTFPLADAGGRLLSATLAFDLTEWRQIQARLARAERRYTQLVDQASDGIAIADADLRLVEVNAAVCRMTGYSREELLERTVGDLLMPDELETLQASRDAVRAGRAIVTERRVRRKDGSVLHVEVSARPFENGGVQAIIRDVSTRREAEQALRESEERFRLLYQYLPLAYHSVSEQGTIVMVNDAWLALTGLSRGRAVGRRFTDLLTRESAAVYETRFVQQIARADVHDLEVTLVGGDQSLVTVTLDGRRGQDAKGEIRVHCALRDVTAARLADARLRESESRYRTLFAESPVSLWEEDFSGIRRYFDRLRALGVTDFDEHFTANPDELADCVESVRVVDVNRATLALYGAESRSQLLAGLDRILGDEGREVFRRSILALARGERSWESEGVNYTLDGDPIRLALQWSVAPGAERTWSRILVSAMDITDRLRVEGALRESEARFERIFRSAPGLMGITRRSDGRFLDVNDVFLRELGYTREAVIGRTVEELGLREDPPDGDVLAALGRQGVIHNLEVRLRRRSGGIFEGLVSVVPLTVSGEDCLLLQAVDTTARRRAEQVSRESQRMLATLMGNLPGMAYQCCDDPERTLLFVSDGCTELTGYPAFDLVGNRRLSYASLILDDDREAVSAGLREAIAHGRPYRLTYRLRHASGQTQVGVGAGARRAVVGRPAGHARGVRLGHHRPQAHRGGPAAEHRAAPPGAEDGGGGAPRRRHRPRLQQPAHGDPRLFRSRAAQARADRPADRAGRGDPPRRGTRGRPDPQAARLQPQAGDDPQRVRTRRRLRGTRVDPPPPDRRGHRPPSEGRVGRLREGRSGASRAGDHEPGGQREGRDAARGDADDRDRPDRARRGRELGARRAGRALRDVQRQRQRRRHGRRDAGEAVRAVLRHQGAGRGHRSRPVRGVRHRPPERGVHRRCRVARARARGSSSIFRASRPRPRIPSTRPGASSPRAAARRSSSSRTRRPCDACCAPSSSASATRLSRPGTGRRRWPSGPNRRFAWTWWSPTS